LKNTNWARVQSTVPKEVLRQFISVNSGSLFFHPLHTSSSATTGGKGREGKKEGKGGEEEKRERGESSVSTVKHSKSNKTIINARLIMRVRGHASAWRAALAEAQKRRSYSSSISSYEDSKVLD
jgi:hypothetical protein